MRRLYSHKFAHAAGTDLPPIISPAQMALSPGTRLGPYEVTAQIGVGGMGEVYRARDGRLQRDVAIKVLPEAFAQDSERLARFEREAEYARFAEPPEHRGDLWAGRCGRREGPRDGAGRGADARRPYRARADPDRRRTCRSRGKSPKRSKPRTNRGIIHRDLKPANIKVRD